MCPTVAVFDLHPGQLLAADAQRLRQTLHKAQGAGCFQLAHASNGSGGGTKLRTSMHQRETRRLWGEIQGPVEGRVAAAAYDQAALVEARGTGDFVVDTLSFEPLDVGHSQASRLERADPCGDDHRARIELRARSGAHVKAARRKLLEPDCFLAEMKRRREGFDLLQQALDQFLSTAHRQRGNVVDRLVRIQLRALPAGVPQ